MILLSNSQIYLLLLYLLFGTQAGSAQRSRSCSTGSQCVPLRSCPQMVNLIRSGSNANMRRVRQSICGFQRRSPLVCCPSRTTPTTRKPTFQLWHSQSLLPSVCGRPQSVDKIVGGSPAPIGGYPWMAALGYREPGRTSLAFICSGSIISSRYILTAAHCLDQKELGRKRLAAIHLGDWDLSTDVDCQISRVGQTCSPPHIVAGYEEFITHPQYNTRGKSSDDIALIRLDRTLDFENDPAKIEPVCLPSSNINTRSFLGKKPVASGWGLTENSTRSNILLRVDVPVVEDSKCRETYKSNFVGKQLCVGGEGGTDTCSGDSGGPLVLASSVGPPFVQIGIVSFGPFPCGLQKFPGVYTSVSDYKDWITSNMRP